MPIVSIRMREYALTEQKPRLVLSLRKQHSNTVQAPALRTYPSDDPVACTIWQAARATSAAITYFEPIKFGNPAVEWIDPGIGFNNPAKALLAEARNLWKDSNDEFDRDNIGIFLSLGTGIPGVINPDGGSNTERILNDALSRLGLPVGWIKMMKEMVTSSGKVSQEMRADLNRSVYHRPYHRFNVEQGLQAIELFQYECEEMLIADTEEYITKVSQEIDDCTRLMATMPLNAPPLKSPAASGGLSALPGPQNDEELQSNGL
jgi:calcium-independent phospholipase A2-gamma